MEKKLNKIEKLLENLAVSTKKGFDYSNERFTGLDNKFDRLEKEFIVTKLRMEENFILVHQELVLIRQELNLLNSEVDRLKNKMDLIFKTEGEDTEVLFKDMKKLKIKVFDLDKQLSFLRKRKTL